MLDRFKRYVLVHLILASVLSVSACIYINSVAPQQRMQKGTLIFNTEHGPAAFHVDIANTPKTRAQGLMNRLHLPDNFGMLFIFEKSDRHSFWMKNTPLSLDIIFLDETFKVVDIISNTTPNTTKTIIPQQNCLYVLETVAGTAKKHLIKQGVAAILQQV